MIPRVSQPQLERFLRTLERIAGRAGCLVRIYGGFRGGAAAACDAMPVPLTLVNKLTEKSVQDKAEKKTQVKRIDARVRRAAAVLEGLRPDARHHTARSGHRRRRQNGQT